MTYSTTITNKGQITLPAVLRKQLKLLPGRKVNVKLHGKQLIIDAPVDIIDVRERNQTFLNKQKNIKITDRMIDDAVSEAALERYERSKK